MLKTYLAAVIVVLSLGNVCLSVTEKQELFQCPFNTTRPMNCSKRLFQTISVTSAIYGQTDENCTECQFSDVTSWVKDRCQDKLSCFVRPLPPRHDPFTKQPPCSPNTTERRSLNVSYDCTNLPGYMGCFRLQNSSQVFQESWILDSMTIHGCLMKCRENHYLFAGLYDGKNCSCGNEIKSSILATRVSTSECNVTCAGVRQNQWQQCGGTNSTDIYKTSVGKCGGDLFVNDEGVVFSPDYPRNYPNGENCEWVISVPQGKVIKVDFYLFHLFKNSSSLANSDILYLRDGSNVNATLLTSSPLTGNLPSPVPTSSSNTIWMKFESKSNVRKRGFIMKYTAVDTPPSSTVTSTAPPSDQTSPSQLATTSTPSVLRQTSKSAFSMTTKSGIVRSTGGLKITPATGKGNNSIIIPTGRSTDPNEEAPPGGSTLSVTIGVAVGINVLVLTAIIVAVVIVMKRRRTPTPVPPSTSPPKVTADVTVDVTADVTPGPEPVYDTVREEEEGGVQLALSGATCSYSAIGQPDVTSDSDRQVPMYSKPDKKKAKTPPNVEDLYTKPLKKESGEVENVLYESAGDFSGASPSQEGGTDNVLYASADEI